VVTINFGLWIKDHDIDDHYKLEGPVFRRWSPDGENDALKFSVLDDSVDIFLWFERHGYIDDSGFIRYEHKKFEIDPEVLPKQKKIYTGALYGKVILHSVSPAQITALKEDDTTNEEYIGLGKLVLKKILDPILSRFTRLLKHTYGQYWIEVYQKFDSRKLPLANHCHNLNMKWSLQTGESGKFLPGTKEIESIIINASSCEEHEYISQEEWFNIQNLLSGNFEPSLSSVFASRSNRLLEEERYSHSLIEAVTAIELSLEEFVRRTINFDQRLEENMRSFWKNPLPTRITLVASLAGVNTDDVGLSISGVTERNKFVHDGLEPDQKVKKFIEGLLRTISHLNNNQNLKYPDADNSNSLGFPI